MVSRRGILKISKLNKDVHRFGKALCGELSCHMKDLEARQEMDSRQNFGWISGWEMSLSNITADSQCLRKNCKTECMPIRNMEGRGSGKSLIHS